MATVVYSTEEIALSNGTVVELRPLPVKHLKKVMAKFGEYTKAVTEAVKEDRADAFDPDGLELIDNLIECCKISLVGLQVTIPAKDIEDVLDMDTIYKILETSADLNLREDNSNLARAVGSAVTNGLN